ncbi:MAG: SHOCT domain-containing protein [Gammaproteobacteria bacterium]|nr:SHOCT domain-containing protein [Gammaproteobacteria bacterium]
MYGFGLGWVFMILFWVLVVLGIIAVVKWLFVSSSGTGAGELGRTRRLGLEILEERYARGEIDREEYLQKRRDLGG